MVLGSHEAAKEEGLPRGDRRCSLRARCASSRPRPRCCRSENSRLGLATNFRRLAPRPKLCKPAEGIREMPWFTVKSWWGDQTQQGGGFGDGPQEGPSCGKECMNQIQKAGIWDPTRKNATGWDYIELTGENAGGYKVARFQDWVVERGQPIFDDLYENGGGQLKVDLAETKIYVGGGQSRTIGFNEFILATPGSDAGDSFFRTGLSIMHELGHQAEISMYGSYSSFMVDWRQQRAAYGNPGMYSQQGSLEWQADRFRDKYSSALWY